MTKTVIQDGEEQTITVTTYASTDSDSDASKKQTTIVTDDSDT